MIRMVGLLAMDNGLRGRLCIEPGEPVFIERVKVATHYGKIAYHLKVAGEDGEHLGWTYAHITFANRLTRGVFRALLYQLFIIWIPLLLLVLAALVLLAQ